MPFKNFTCLPENSTAVRSLRSIISLFQCILISTTTIELNHYLSIIIIIIVIIIITIIIIIIIIIIVVVSKLWFYNCNTKRS